MEPILNDLIAILEEQRCHQAALVELSERKTSAITVGDADSLHGIVEEEKALLGLIKGVEKRQSRCVREIADALGLPETQVRMSLIIEKAEGSQREALLRIREDLTGLIERQMKHNEINMRLLQMNMDYVQLMLNTASNQKSGATYGQGGSIQNAPGSPRKLLDRKV